MSPGYGVGVYGTELYDLVPVGPGLKVRELPPLRTHIEAVTPSGRHYRWGEDEPDPANVPSGLRHSSTMPGGYESMDCTLPRKPGIDYSDLERLTTLRIWGAGGDLAGEYRLERAPRVSGDAMAVSPSAVGYQAHLEDDKSATVIYIDRDLSAMGAASLSRTTVANRNFMSPNTVPGHGSTPSLEEGFDDNPWTTAGKPTVEAWYDAGSGNLIGNIACNWAKSGTVDETNASWSWQAVLSSDDVATTTDSSGNLRAAGPGLVSLDATGSRRFALLQHSFEAANTGATGKRFAIYWSNVRVLGDHGLTLINPAGGISADEGFYASDVVAHAVGRWAPLIQITTESVQASTFIIPQLAFRDPTTAGEIIRQATRFGLQDWAVWDGPTFWWHPRGAFGRSWRARIGPAQLEETGPQVDRLWNSVMVQYQDVDGSTRTTGPVGSGADTEDAVLEDSDPDNPATILGINRREKLIMGVGTAASATEVGRRFLEESKALDRSGRARLVGHVTDDRGVLHPYWRVKAGDTISFVDAADSSLRRIVRVDHDRPSRTASVDLDAPPEGLQALLERLGVVLAPLSL